MKPRTMTTAPSDTTGTEGMPGLFAAAFTQSKNEMALVDASRRLVDCNGPFIRLVGYERGEIVGQPIYELIDGGPLLSADEWKAALTEGRFTGEAKLVCAQGERIAVQWAATTEIVTGRQLTLLVVLSTSRWGARFRRSGPSDEPQALSRREREIVRLVALGYTGPEIADQLQIAHDTVRTHVRNAMVKVDARSRAHLVAKTLGSGLVLE